MTPWRRIAGAGGKEKATLEELMRERIRATIEAIVEEELEAALGAAPSHAWVRYAPATGTASAHAR